MNWAIVSNEGSQDGDMVDEALKVLSDRKGRIKTKVMQGEKDVVLSKPTLGVEKTLPSGSTISIQDKKITKVVLPKCYTNFKALMDTTS